VPKKSSESGNILVKLLFYLIVGFITFMGTKSVIGRMLPDGAATVVSVTFALMATAAIAILGLIFNRRKDKKDKRGGRK
jgi:hypothetical protein